MWTNCSSETVKSPTRQNGKLKRKWFNLLRLRSRSPKDSPSIDGSILGDPGVVHQGDEINVKIEILTFAQNLAQGRLCVAGQQLIDQEERLFGEITATHITHGQEEKQIAKDRAMLLGAVESALKASLKNLHIENADLLRSAVIAVLQEEEQDRRWRQTTHRSLPAWRPSGWRAHHDAALSTLVQGRMDEASIPADQAGLSSVQTEICTLGKQLKEDLLLVVKNVMPCYPPEMDVCNVYVQLYHQAFSSRLQNIAEFGLNEKDSTYLLCWVNDYYPSILAKDELAGTINYEALGKLLPENLSAPLEKQYLFDREADIKTCLNRVLKKTEEDWISGAQPKSRDGYFFLPLAIDVIQLINSAVLEAEVVQGDQRKAQTLVCHLEDFLKSFQKLQADVIRGNKANSRPFVMAVLPCVEQFREYIAKKGNIFLEAMRENCLTIVTVMTESGNSYLLGPLHKELKQRYPALGTSDWLKKHLFAELLDAVEIGIEDLHLLTTPCFQGLMGQLHLDLTVEYVQRLLKRDMKLKDSSMQEQAAWIVTQDAQRLNTLFDKLGSKQVWLNKVLPRIAEVLKLQDLPSIQLEIVLLGAAYPDLSDKHVSALLKLKTNLCSADRKKVNAVLLDTLAETNQSTAQCFFSRVHLK